MIVARIPVGDDDSVGESVWRIEYSAGRCSMGRENTFLRFDDNSTGDTVVMLKELMNSAGG